MTLIILAAGLGTRFGGPKQFFPLGPNGECLFHYSLFNAIQNGIDQLILVTRIEIRDKAEHAIKNLPITTQIVLQETINNKPRGTADALLTAITASDDTQFILINADDYYGPESFAAAQALAKQHPQIGAIPYLLQNTLSQYGGVSRAICENQDGLITSISETHHLERVGNHATGTQNGTDISTPLTTPVSMNIFLFDKSIEEDLRDYVSTQIKNKGYAEITLPDYINEKIQREQLAVPYANSQSEWFGMTYAEDLEAVRERLNDMHQSGQFPSRLW
ncbi:MAG: NDP-sugar synthase [Fimbriimonadaceae bacterium]